MWRVKLSYGSFSMSVNGEPTRVRMNLFKKNMVRYMRSHGRFAHCSCKNAVRQPSILASCIEIYYYYIVLESTTLCKLKNSTLRYECDETFSDEWCNHTCQENVFSHEYRTKFYITRCENADLFTHSEWYKNFFHVLFECKNLIAFFSKLYFWNR